MGSLSGHTKEMDRLSAADRNFAPRMRLLEAAYRDQVARLNDGCCPRDVVWELRDAYRRAHQLRPIQGAP